MKISGKKYIFDNLIKNYQEQNIKYSFLRKVNVEELNHDEDLDIVIDKSKVNLNDQIINNITEKDQFLVIKNFVFNDNIVYTIFINEKDFIDVLHIHFQLNLRINQITIALNNNIYLSNNKILTNYKNINGINILNDDYFLYSLIIHCIFDKGYFNDIYQDIIKEYIKIISKHSLEIIFKNNFPGYYSCEALNLIYDEKYEELISNKKKLFNLKIEVKTRFMFFTNNIIRFIKNIKRLWNNKGVFIVLLGPDGSGKTTISEKLIESINHSRKKYIYLGSNKKRIIPRPNIMNRKDQICESQANNISVKKMGLKKSLRIYLRAIYNASEYILYYYLRVFPLLLKDYLVVGDRYFYDVLALKDSNLSPIEEKLILKMIPNPSCTILLDNDPEVIKKRKDELEIDEIERLLFKYEELGKNNAGINMYKIKNEDIENTTKRLIEIFWDNKVNK